MEKYPQRQLASRLSYFVVLCNGTKAQALAMKEELGGVLSTMGLTLSEEKTKVTHISEGFDFLGYRVKRCMGRNGTMVTKVLIADKAIKKFQHKMRSIISPSTTQRSFNAVITAQNALTRGWCEYYRCTNNPSKVFRKLSDELYWLTAHWLGRKYKTSIPAIMKKYLKGNTFGTDTRKLVRPDEYKAKRFVAKSWHNPYTETEKVQEEKDRIKRESLLSYDQLWDGQERRQGSMDLREETLLRDGPICAVCKKTFHPYEVHVDHIIARARFKDPRQADRLENQQVLCTDCHRAKTKTDLKVLRRMR